MVLRSLYGINGLHKCCDFRCGCWFSGNEMMQYMIELVGSVVFATIFGIPVLMALDNFLEKYR